MLDNIKMGKLIAAKRKEAGLTRQQPAEKPDISF